MKEKSGHNWSCHEDSTKLCTGFAIHATKYWPHLNIKEGGLISYEDWYHLGPEEAMKRARTA